jgi:primosomal protein N' (replication factor Y)
MTIYYEVAVNFPGTNSILTYEAPNDLSLEKGMLVELPLGRRKEKGCILDVGKAPGDFKTKEITSLLSEQIKVSESELKLYSWMSSYYHYSLGQLIFESLPKLLKRPRDIKLIKGEAKELPFTLNEEQSKIYEKIKTNLLQFSKNLIHGVTGSGKTAIYLNLIKDILKNNKSVLFLVPEINLTPQFTKTLSDYLDCEVATYHSGISNSEKYNLWKKSQDNEEPLVVLGVRSSVFLPIKNLGMIIVDEEHDQSFKQDDRCPYNARDVAIKKSSLLNIPVVMGSATPSIENYSQLKDTEKYFVMRNRVSKAAFPEIELVDLRNNEFDENIWPLTTESLGAIENAFSNNEQVLVFVNKLGFSNYVQCSGCGHQFMCPNCSVTLTPYMKRNSMDCHHCDYKIPMPKSCPECGCLTLNHKGFGTEKVEGILKNIYPDKNIDRFDRDEIKTTEQLKEKLSLFHQHKIDLLVGTQMLSKGHNFEKVNTVVILGIDSQLNFPDFRAEERVYQLITQVAGRAGRYQSKSKVIIQTHNPENPLYKMIQSNSFEEFYSKELEIRKMCLCPPYTKIAMLYFHGRFQDKVIDYVTNEANRLKDAISEHFPSVQILGPRPSIIEKRANKFTWAIMLKSDNINDLHNLIHTFELNAKPLSGVSFKIDIDPYFLS